MPATQRMTSDEYLALRRSEERRWVQLVEGELVVDEPLPVHRAVKLEPERSDPLTSPQLEGFGLPLADLFPE